MLTPGGLYVGSIKITMTPKIVANDYAYVIRQLKEDMQAHMDNMNDEMLSEAQAAWTAGRPGRQTGAAAGSFYTVSPYENDIIAAHSEAVAKAQSLYIGANEDGQAMNSEWDFNRVVMREPVTNGSDDPSIVMCGIATPLEYVGWWNQGHYNTLSRRVEYFPLMNRLREKGNRKILAAARSSVRSIRTRRNKKWAYAMFATR